MQLLWWGLTPKFMEDITIYDDYNSRVREDQETIDTIVSEAHHYKLIEGECMNRREGEHANIRIRKLTPKECWRLMGFSDEDFAKAQKVNSDTQLYKQAGNSIVVNVLMAIFKEML